MRQSTSITACFCWLVGWLVSWSVSRSVILYFFLWFYFFFLPHCSFPNGLVTSNMAPAHPHATSGAMYPALFLDASTHLFKRLCPSICPSVGPSVGPSVHLLVRHTLLFLGFCGVWLHCGCLSDWVTSNTAPAHLHATGVAVYPALFFHIVLPLNKILLLWVWVHSACDTRN